MGVCMGPGLLSICIRVCSLVVVARVCAAPGLRVHMHSHVLLRVHRHMQKHMQKHMTVPWSLMCMR